MFEKILKGNRQLFPFFVILAQKVYFMDISHIFKRQKVLYYLTLLVN